MSLSASPLPIRTFRLPSRVYKSTRGLAERFIRSKLRTAGYMTWRGHFFDMPYAPIYETYEKLWLHYEHLKILLYERVGHERFNTFLTYCKEHHGTPDFVAFHKQTERLLFIEVKYLHEQLMDNQIRCIQFIRSCLGIQVEIHRVVPQGKRIVHGTLDAHSKELEILRIKAPSVRKEKTGGELSLRDFLRKTKR